MLLAALREPAPNANRFDGGGSFLGELIAVDGPNLGQNYLGKLDGPGGDWAGRGGSLGKFDWDGFGQERAAGAAAAPSPLSLNPADLLAQQQGLELDKVTDGRSGADSTRAMGREPPTAVPQQRVPDEGKALDLGKDHGQDRDQGLLPG